MEYLLVRGQLLVSCEEDFQSTVTFFKYSGYNLTLRSDSLLLNLEFIS